MSGRIPVTVVTGFLGSGKTTLLNRVLDTPEASRTAVIVNEIGDVGLDHKLFKHINDNVVLLESGCVCCGVRGELVTALRDLFMAALQKKIPALTRVLIETTGVADPAPVMYTLRYERFLNERYVYDGCIAVVDGVFGRQQLGRHFEAMQQAVLADAVVLSKTDLAGPEEIAELENALRDINADASLYRMQALPGLPELLAASSQNSSMGARRPGSAGKGALWSQPGLGRRVEPSHRGVRVLTLRSPESLARSEFLRAMSLLQATDAADLLRFKGLIRFRGEAGPSIVHGVHQQLYPIEPWPGSADAAPDTALVFVLRDADVAAFEQKVRALLSGDEAVVP
ncbi:GTP-binding protein [Paralcaligenes sp. KSB-10]|uniref:CobW family GTP-binding protein n=1 Tax=Paralcaligenes sp. KSB-10 TaxID=2901142 RepID=UPI001E387F76|nr:GTP-binding protein [Paralcaligenes sp. KSB-10]UHL65957.1 GTP-binding protein [Paralcaligenes sp. KSB-10]